VLSRLDKAQRDLLLNCEDHDAASVRIGSRLGRIYCATSDGYLVHFAMMQQRSELCGDYLLQGGPREWC